MSWVNPYLLVSFFFLFTQKSIKNEPCTLDGIILRLIDLFLKKIEIWIEHIDLQGYNVVVQDHLTEIRMAMRRIRVEYPIPLLPC